MIPGLPWMEIGITIIVLSALWYLARRFRKGAVAEDAVKRLEDEQENEFDAQKELDRPASDDRSHVGARVRARRRRMSKPHDR